MHYITVTFRSIPFSVAEGQEEKEIKSKSKRHCRRRKRKEEVLHARARSNPRGSGGRTRLAGRDASSIDPP